MIEHFDIILVTETVPQVHAQTRQLLSETVHKTHFRHRNHRECRDFDTREQFTSHKVGSNTRRVIVFNICQNLEGRLIRISEFPEASVMIEQLRVGITPRPQVVFYLFPVRSETFI